MLFHYIVIELECGPFTSLFSCGPLTGYSELIFSNFTTALLSPQEADVLHVKNETTSIIGRLYGRLNKY